MFMKMVLMKSLADSGHMNFVESPLGLWCPTNRRCSRGLRKAARPNSSSSGGALPGGKQCVCLCVSAPLATAVAAAAGM